ncbi:DUF881 domain-containing protein [Myceligenerans xiligouense]|uniref:Uncharacterized protein YlxW (UPF0749 family) n=1 Tax=Myceligenerans xiligouense TaxID=253184 RepID=A0A3N4ZP09_9MICO|nr:DUF881 domain-containing protein [Myceligenerans xiligouense]RPF21591.1 uncharacterized protein YlxW (UPF0749 family) [Myceligenerans xiligouense]
MNDEHQKGPVPDRDDAAETEPHEPAAVKPPEPESAGAGSGEAPPADEALVPPGGDGEYPEDAPAASRTSATDEASGPENAPGDEAEPEPGREPSEDPAASAAAASSRPATGTREAGAGEAASALPHAGDTDAPGGTEGSGDPDAPGDSDSDSEGDGNDDGGGNDDGDGEGGGDGNDGDVPPRRAGGTRRLWEVFRPRNRRAEYITAALCIAFGFALAVQVAQSTGDQLASLRQDELVRLLDEVTQRGEQLDEEVANLTEARDDLLSADGQDRAARELARQRAEYEGILSGRLPAEGPGVVVEIQAGPGTLTASSMFNMLEELRNAGVEAQQVNDVRIVTSSHFEETVDEEPRILLDGRLLEPPYTWVAIGDPETVDRALEIPGGALPTLRDAGASAEVTRREHVVVDATRAPADPEHAEPSEE